MKPIAQASFWVLVLLCQTQVLGVNITDLVFGKTANYMPAAFGDFNSDKHTDMIVLTEDLKTVKVLISNLEAPLLRESDQGLSCTFEKLWIKSIVPGDFDGNGAMDLLLVPFNKVSRLYEVYVLWGNQKNMTLSCTLEDKPLMKLKSQPLVMDVNGDMIPDLFGEDENGNRTFWIFGPKGPPRPELIVAPDPEPLPHLKLPSSHAFIDLDSDLAADLWITAEGQFEIWSSIDGKYSLNKTISVPEGLHHVGQTAFADVNLDGNIEAIIPVCNDAQCKKSYLALYDFRKSSWNFLDVDFVEDDGTAWAFPFESTGYRFLDTVTLRVGDYNLDGYPDFLVTLIDASQKPRVILMENSVCDDSSCQYQRKFVNQWNIFKAFGETVLGTFCDFQEDGTLDVLLVQKTDDGKYHMNVYKDSVEYDAVFVKVLIGGCYGEICKLQTVPYGTNQPGPSIRYSITTAKGGTQSSRATQLSQTAHSVLQLPYTIFGLGRNWNFVEVLDVGIPKGNYSDTLTNSFTQIIPNSQLIVIPYPMEHPDQWVSKLFITPSKAMLMTAGALIGTCLFVAAIIGILHRREKQQDKREKQQDAHKFHFDAM